MFEKGVPYHIINRSIEGKEIFKDEDDFLRGIFYSYAANIGRPAFNLYRRDIRKAAYAILNGKEVPQDFIIVEHPPLVYSLSFAFVVNHRHDVLISNTGDGISKYFQNLNTATAKYLNLKYGHRDNVFPKRRKVIPIRTESQLYAVIRYVNIKNPLDVYQPNWIHQGLKNRQEALNFLHNFQFSSFPDLTGKRNSKLLAPKSILEQYLIKEITGEDCDKFINDYLEEKLAVFRPFFLE